MGIDRTLFVLNEDDTFKTSFILIEPLFSILTRSLIENQLFDHYVHVEVPYLLVFGKMETNSFSVDKLYLRKAMSEWGSSLTLHEQELKKQNDYQHVNIK